MKSFFNDLFKMARMNWTNELDWLKNHWRGYIVLLVICGLTGFSLSRLYDMIKAGEFRKIMNKYNWKN